MKHVAIAVIITGAHFPLPSAQRRCHVHRYHLWRWKVKDDVHVPERPPDGLPCQCRLMDFDGRTHRRSRAPAGECND